MGVEKFKPASLEARRLSQQFRDRARDTDMQEEILDMAQRNVERELRYMLIGQKAARTRRINRQRQNLDLFDE